MKYLCLAINGLHEELFANPLGQLASFLNRKTQEDLHFEVVGGVDPRPFIDQFKHTCDVAHGSGYEIILLGHSLGAMMVFYLCDYLQGRSVKVPLAVAIDATQWGTNNVAFGPYALANGSPGKYWVPDNVDHFLYFRQPVYPGGGHAILALGNTHTKLDNYERIEPHVSLPIIMDIQDKILDAVKEV